MQKIVLIVGLNTSNIKSVCNAPFYEYQYYKKLSNDTNTSDMKERYLEISDKFHTHYKNIKKHLYN